jgi:hypothetical protein
MRSLVVMRSAARTDRPSSGGQAIPGDSQHVLATFVLRGNRTVYHAVLVARLGGIETLRDRRSHLIYFGDRDIWCRSYIRENQRRG